MAKHRILFVCTGNICRSPTAEGVFRHYVRESGLAGDFLIDSAGTHGYHIGEPPDSRAIAAALARGIDMADLRARRISRQDFTDFDLILAMDQGHYDILQQMRTSIDPCKLSLFLDYAPHIGKKDVPDPYYGSHRDFEDVLDLVEHGVQGLLDHLKRG